MSASRARASTLAITSRSPSYRPSCSRYAHLAPPRTRSIPSCLPSQRRHQSSVAAAIQTAKHMFNNAAPSPIGIDPLQSVAKELKFLTGNIQQLLGSGHPMLDTVAKYYTQSEGKYVRPMLVLLMSQATALTVKHERSTPQALDVDSPMSPSTVLSDSNPSSPLTSPPVVEDLSDTSVLPSQRRLAEITELIHTASLLHDDVIDNSISRRSAPSANIQFGNKMA
ncbi:decaprenyl-diphosphate synthase subunit 1, partial [Aureobasidium melanogenum]